MRYLLILLLIIPGIIQGQKQIDIKNTIMYHVIDNDTLVGTPSINSENATQKLLNHLEIYPDSQAKIIVIGGIDVDVIKDDAPDPVSNINNSKIEFYIDSLEYTDFVIRKDYGSAHRGGWYNLRKFYHQYGSDKYLVNIKEIGEQPTHYVLDSIRYQDSIKSTRQYFFTKHWLFSKREHDNLDSLKVMPFSEFGFTPGAAYFKNGDTLRRHTQSHYKKYYQVRALDTTYQVIDILPIYGNPLKH